MAAVRKTLSSSVKFSLAGFPHGLCDISPGHMYVLSARRVKDVMRMALSIEIEQRDALSPYPWLITDVPLDLLTEDFSPEDKTSLLERSNFFHFEKLGRDRRKAPERGRQGEPVSSAPMSFKEIKDFLSKFQDLANRVLVIILHESSFEYGLGKSKEQKQFRLSDLEDIADIEDWASGIDLELEGFIHYLQKEHITVLLAVYGNHTAELRNLLQAVQLDFMGFAEINNKDGQLMYHINFWRTPNGNYNNYNVPLILKDHRFEVGKLDLSHVQVNVIDRGLVFTSSRELKDASGDADNYFYLPTNEALFQKGMSLLAATVVFTFTRDMDAVELGKKIFQLRKDRGADLKIFVRISSEGVRQETEAFLFACGAMVFQVQSSLQHAIQVITSTFELRSARSIPASFEEIHKKFIGIDHKGMVEPKKFIELLESVLQDVEAEYIGKGTLVELLPRTGISVEDVMQCFHPKRRGDIGTITGGRLWIFFSGCTPIGLEISFIHSFSFSVDQLVNSYRAYFSVEDVLGAIRRDMQVSGEFEEKAETLEMKAAAPSEQTYGEKDLESIFPPGANAPIPSAAYLQEHPQKGASTVKTETGDAEPNEASLEDAIPDDVRALCETRGIAVPDNYYHEKNKLGREKDGEVFPLVRDLFLDGRKKA